MGDERPLIRIEEDPSTGRPVLVAPQRSGRPIYTASGHDGAEVCPFCTGAEAQTPPELDAVREPGTQPNQPGWRVRAFANKYPATPWHEVIAEGAGHSQRPSDVQAEIWSDALGVWRRRIAAMEAIPEVACAFLFKNVGREAGASIAHNHSQLVGLPELPPRLAIELQRHRELGSLVMRELQDAERDGRIVIAGEHHIALSPRHPRLPCETWIAPRDPRQAFEDPRHDADLADVLQRMFVAVDRALGLAPFNLWLHRVPDEDFHWHFELQPRHGFLAGLELGAEAMINSVPATDAAARLREADPRPR